MNKYIFTFTVFVIVAFLCVASKVDADETFRVIHADAGEVLVLNNEYVHILVGNVEFAGETGRIFCDSAIWLKGRSVNLKGSVFIDDEEFQIKADSVHYDLVSDVAIARGRRVELFLFEDSIFAVGTHAFYHKTEQTFYMEERPTIYFGYPDTARMVAITADRVDYLKGDGVAEAEGDVDIVSKDINTHSGCAIIDLDSDNLDLLVEPTATRGKSVLAGDYISVQFEDDLIQRIDVSDSATADFSEAVDADSTDFDRSKLSGSRLNLSFDKGKLDNIICYGQAYSWYNPSSRGAVEARQNSVSGDTITFAFTNDSLTSVTVVGGSIGSFSTGPVENLDSLVTVVSDTVNYTAHIIYYNLRDSVITLTEGAHLTSKKTSLDAQYVLFDTKQRIIEAFSASTAVDSLGPEYRFRNILQPNDIPIVLKDGTQSLLGDYLIYSIDTEKGRIVQSKSAYDNGTYYGEKMYREQENIAYIDDGRYTTCDADEPHFHFHAPHMKLIEGEKLIARPIIFYIERVPLFVLPYYVFPLKKGRHSGILPFTFGKFERGDRYVKNIGYYWAASDYWDWQGSFDYHEQQRQLKFNSTVQYNNRYVQNGSFGGSYTKTTSFNSLTAKESGSVRWAVQGNYKYIGSPTFKVSGNGKFQSDSRFEQDYSQNLDEILNRSITSRINFSKRFGKGVSLSGHIRHTENLDTGARNDLLPSVNLSLPAFFPFGNGSTDPVTGERKTRWYQDLNFRYTPALTNISDAKDADSTIVYPDSTEDTVSFRSRLKYVRLSHNPRITLPGMKLFKHLFITPRISYSETWFQIFETDRSRAAGVAPGNYRTYKYSGGVQATTTLYGTVYPNIFGLTGLRHVVSPSVTYSYSPEIDRHPNLRKFVRADASSKGQSLRVHLGQIFQAKIRRNLIEESLQLLTLNSSFSYNPEKDFRPLTSMSSNYTSGVIPRISLSGGISHTFYDPNDPTDNSPDFLSPYLESFSFQTNFSLAGKYSIFDDPFQNQNTVDTTANLPGSLQGSAFAPSAVSGSGWSVNVAYNYSERGRHTTFWKSSSLTWSARFYLTPITSVNFSQSYNPDRRKVVYSRVSIQRQIHCWSGSIFWVPVGSTAGFGFRLAVTALPEIKIDNNFDGSVSSIGRRF